MLSLRELSKTYKKLYPEYPNPLAALNRHDEKLKEIKREALLPHLKNLEGQLVIYRDQLTTFGILFDVETSAWGFQAELWMINTIYVPEHIDSVPKQKQCMIKCSWHSMRLLGDRINCMPVGWVIWPEEIFVNEIEKIYLLQGRIHAHFAINGSLMNQK
jgi:hypothetical protein